jgi:hypothetical protein
MNGDYIDGALAALVFLNDHFEIPCDKCDWHTVCDLAEKDNVARDGSLCMDVLLANFIIEQRRIEQYRNKEATS